MLVSLDIHRLLLRISAIILVVCLNAGLALKTKVTSQWGVPLVVGVTVGSVFLGSVLPDWISGLLSSWRWYRRMIMGETWIEGAWLLETRRAHESAEANAGHPRIGIVAYSYHGRYLSLRTEGHHLEFTDVTGQTAVVTNGHTLHARDRVWLESDPILAQSTLAFIDSSLTYINVFKYDSGDGGGGTATGWFKRGEGRRWADEFTATIVTKGGDVLYQRGKKLEDTLVRNLAKKYPSDWEEVLIRHRFIIGDSWRSRLGDIVQV